MKLFDLQACNTASHFQKRILQDLDMEVRCAVSRLNGATDYCSQTGETMSMTMLLALAADIAMACPTDEHPTEADFVEAARRAYAWGQKRHTEHRVRFSS